jgi:hypothetical protein
MRPHCFLSCLLLHLLLLLFILIIIIIFFLIFSFYFFLLLWCFGPFLGHDFPDHLSPNFSLFCCILILQYPRITFVGTRKSSTITMWSIQYNLSRRKNVVSATLLYIFYINILVVFNYPHHLRLCGSKYFPVFVSEESIVLAIFWEGVHVLLSYRKMLRMDVLYGFTGTFQLMSRH